ncbi:NAD(P)/FAD-dependent oxidoreductase [Cellulomonas shaoxiangyii]|uniref:FAD-binding oxidoreductase n=1 Tax=Cellulomonas shaoxiangyii TaxID=2566013 RepID=A0A4P7SGD6_9CELL|nr:FAD-binding oxidoreductase [Cellulomonas shaoxiangyii]QCB92678.1 FAD-binding oxidoreductase [Cellulomonas shaoxiangyii]TGY83425.1 FAD-binding oxidoreductase [Cellulomonas shaoxiangyii]
MSERCDVAVVGGGLLGCATAHLLAREGADVVLLERDQVNQHASGQNAGSLHFQLEYRMIEAGLDAARTAAEAMPLHLDASARWDALAAEIGPALGVARHGGLMLADDDATVRLLEAKAALERERGLDVHVLGTREVHDLAPYLSPAVLAAAYCPSEGRANARTAAPALARAAAAHGARIRTRTGVDSLRRDGRTWTLGTSTRTPSDVQPGALRADAVVLAAGVWTRTLGRMLGVELPVTVLGLMMSVTERTRAFLPHLVQHAGTRLSLKQTADGNVLVGGGWPAALVRDADGTPDRTGRGTVVPASLAGNARAAVRAVPRLAHLQTLRTWVGATTVGPDQLPLVGPVPGAPGAFVATGGSAFTLAPSFAQVLGDLVQGRPAAVDVSPYDPRRWA